MLQSPEHFAGERWGTCQTRNPNQIAALTISELGLPLFSDSFYQPIGLIKPQAIMLLISGMWQCEFYTEKLRLPFSL